MNKFYLTTQLFFLAIIANGQCNPVFSNVAVTNNTVCGNGNVVVTCSGGSLGGASLYEWRAVTSNNCLSGTLNNGTPFGNLGAPVVVVNNSSFTMPTTGPSTYYLVLTATGGSCGSTIKCASTFLTVNRIGAPTISAPGTVFFCPGTSASIGVTASSGATYSWTKNGVAVSGATTQTINLASPSLTNAGVYRCIATNGCGTATSSPITFTTLSNENIVGAAATLSNTTGGYQVPNYASQGITYNWTLPSGGTITAGVNTHSVSVNWGSALGTHTISVLKTLGTCSVTDTKTVSVVLCGNNPLFPATITPTICAGASANLFLSGVSFYTWSTGQQNTQISVTPSVTTVYSVQGNDALGCLQTGSVQVSVLPLPTFTVSATSSSICAGESSTLSINAVNFTDYVWYNPFTPNTSIVVTPTVTTNYGFQVFNTNQCGVSGGYTVTVDPNPTLNLVLTNPITCAGETNTITVSGANTYTWTENNANTTSIVISPTANTSYSVSGANSTGCLGDAQITVAVTICASLNEFTTSKFNVYPNPAKNYLIIEGEENVYYTIVNTLGQTMVSGKITEENGQIKISNLSSGVYFIYLKNENMSGFNRFIKE